MISVWIQIFFSIYSIGMLYKAIRLFSVQLNDMGLHQHFFQGSAIICICLVKQFL